MDAFANPLRSTKRLVAVTLTRTQNLDRTGRRVIFRHSSKLTVFQDSFLLCEFRFQSLCFGFLVAPKVCRRPFQASLYTQKDPVNKEECCMMCFYRYVLSMLRT